MSDVIYGVDELRRRHESRHDADPSDLVRQFEEARQAHEDALEGLHRAAGDNALTASQQRAWDAHTREARALDEAAAELTRQLKSEQDDRVAARRVRWGAHVSPQSTGSRGAAWDGLDRGDSPTGWIHRGHDVLAQSEVRISDAARERIAEAMTGKDAPAVAQFTVARSNPHYESAFTKVLANPERAFFTFTPEESAAFSQVESVRASLGTGTGTGGYLIPLSLDPNVAVIANAGAASPFRKLATVKTTATSPHRSVTSAGVTASWIGENSQIGDASPTFVGKDIPLWKLAALVTGSYEIFADAGDALRENLPMLLADARDVLEATAFVSGNGTSQPTGIITAISATVASTVTATTRGAFTSASTADTLALLNSLSPRIRQSPAVAALANNTTIGTIRQQGIGTSGAMLTDLSAAVPQVLGVPFHEASAVTAATTSGSILAVAGDLSAYMIVDHIQGPSLEFVSNMFDGDGLPTGTRGWVYWARTGADVMSIPRFSFLLA